MLAKKTTEKISQLYGSARCGDIADRIEALLGHYAGKVPAESAELTQRDVLLITYADSLRQSGNAPLACLREFCSQHLSDCISMIHLLPFFPYSSDDGFAVIDYRQVKPEYGHWQDIAGHFDRSLLDRAPPACRLAGAGREDAIELGLDERRQDLGQAPVILDLPAGDREVALANPIREWRHVERLGLHLDVALADLFGVVVRVGVQE